MESLDSPSAEGDSPEQRSRHQLDARFHLLTLDNFENIAQHCEAISSDETISASESSARATLAAHYRAAVGVAVEQRHLLRRLLEEVAVTGKQGVQHIIENVRGQSRNGLSSGIVSDESVTEDWL